PPLPFPSMIETLLPAKLVTAKSGLPSRLKSSTARPLTKDPAVTLMVDRINPPLPSPSNKSTTKLAPLEASKSGLPSRLKSPTARFTDENPRAIGEPGVFANAPAPFPRNIVTSFEPSPATAKSGFPSLLKSAETFARGLVPMARGDPGGWLKLAPVQPAAGKIDAAAPSSMVLPGTAIDERLPASVPPGEADMAKPTRPTAPARIARRIVQNNFDARLG